METEQISPLKPAQAARIEKALGHLASGATVAQAAAKAGIHRATLYRACDKCDTVKRDFEDAKEFGRIVRNDELRISAVQCLIRRLQNDEITRKTIYGSDGKICAVIETTRPLPTRVLFAILERTGALRPD